MRIEKGTRLGPYEVAEQVGAGGMGEIYRARDARLGRDVAVKILPGDFAEDQVRLLRFEQEARAVAALNHPNILAVFDIGKEGASPFMVTELLEGETLRERLEHGPLSPRRTAALARQMAAGLAAAHGSGVVHRDFKPENVFLTTDGRVKILDFGLVKLGQGADSANGMTMSTPFTLPGTVLGTAGYMSPEQVRGEDVDARSDIFSFGAVLYEMLTGRKTFTRHSAAETMAAILKEDPPEIPSSGDGLTPTLDRIVRRCLEKRPEQRFQTATDLAFALDLPAGASTTSPAPEPATVTKRRPTLWLALLAVALVAAASGFLAAHRSLPPQPSYVPLTFQSGYVRAARFAPDGQAIVFATLWGGRPLQLHTGRTDTRVSQPVGPPDTDLLAVSSRAELAVALDRTFPAPWTPVGTLATMSMAGGTPRPIAENVIDADFSPDGEDLAIARLAEGGCRLEYPVGTMLHSNAGYISDVRVSPSGDLVAFMDHPLFGDDRGTVSVVDRHGHVRVLSEEWPTEQGLAWSHDGKEIWFTAGGDNEEMSVRTLDLSGKVRLVLRSPHRVRVHDVNRAGELLITTDAISSDIHGGTIGEGDGPSLASFRWAAARDLSADGSLAVINEFNAGNLSEYKIYLRKVDGTPPISLGVGAAMAISPDGRFILVTAPGRKGDLRMIPVGAGDPRVLPGGDLTFQSGTFFPDGGRAMVIANEPGRPTRTFVVDITGAGSPRPLTEEGVTGQLVSPDGRDILAQSASGAFEVGPVQGGAPRPVPGLTPRDLPVQWLDGGRGIIVRQAGAAFAHIERVDLQTGARQQWVDVEPSSREGVLAVSQLFFTRDGRHYLHEVRRVDSDLFAVRGLR